MRMPYDFTDNLARIMRMQNLFGPQTIASQTNDTNLTGNIPLEEEAVFTSRNKPVSNVAQVDPASRWEELYTPETEAADRFNELMNQYPERNKPGVWRKIGASLMGIGGRGNSINQQERFLYAPYYRQLEDWKNQMDPASVAMTQERMRNVNERQATGNIVAAEINAAKSSDIFNVRMMDLDRKVDQARTQMEISKMRLDLQKDNAEALQAHREAQRALATAEAERRQIQREIDNDRRDRALEDRVKNTESLIKDRETDGGSSSQADLRTGRINRAQKFQADNPKLGKYIHINGTSISIDPPKKPMKLFGREMPRTGPTDEEYKQIVGAIMGSEPNTTSTTSTTSSSTGKIRVRRLSDNKTGTIDAKDFDPKKYEKM